MPNLYDLSNIYKILKQQIYGGKFSKNHHIKRDTFRLKYANLVSPKCRKIMTRKPKAGLMRNSGIIKLYPQFENPRASAWFGKHRCLPEHNWMFAGCEYPLGANIWKLFCL